MIWRLKKDVLSQLPEKRRQRILVDVSNDVAMNEIASMFSSLNALNQDDESELYQKHGSIFV